MSCITDMHGDLHAESSGSLFKSPFAGGGGILYVAATLQGARVVILTE